MKGVCANEQFIIVLLNSKPDYESEEVIAPGQLIGVTGDSGDGGYHLHIELLTVDLITSVDYSAYLDPRVYFK